MFIALLVSAATATATTPTSATATAATAAAAAATSATSSSWRNSAASEDRPFDVFPPSRSLSTGW